MNTQKKNQLACGPTHCEPRVMLAGGLQSNTPPGIDATIGASVQGNIGLTVSGDRTFALVPTRESQIPATGAGIDRFATRVERQANASFSRAVDQATKTNSPGGRRVTQGESMLINNSVAATAARLSRGAAYVGETGTNRLSRIGEGTLPSVVQGGTRENLFELGFNDAAFGDAENASELPDQLILNPNTLESLREIRATSIADQSSLAVNLTQAGTIDDVNFSRASGQPITFFESTAPGEIPNESRVSARTTPVAQRNAVTGRTSATRQSFR